MLVRGHLVHYSVLVVVLLLGFVGLWVFRFRPQLQLIVVGLTVLSYIVWGILHHYLEDRLRREVIGEYILIGALVFLLFALILRP